MKRLLITTTSFNPEDTAPKEYLCEGGIWTTNKDEARVYKDMPSVMDSVNAYHIKNWAVEILSLEEEKTEYQKSSNSFSTKKAAAKILSKNSQSENVPPLEGEVPAGRRGTDYNQPTLFD